MLQILSLFIIVTFTACASYVPDQSLSKTDIFPVKKSNYQKTNSYTIQKGDSLWRISKQCGVPVQKIMDENRIINPHELKIGQKINLPVCGYQVQKNSGQGFSWPINGEVVSFYGEKTGNVINQGINIKTDKVSPVKACAGGVVVFADYLRGWGKTVIIKHQDSVYSFYCNLEELKVKPGINLQTGSTIGKVGAVSSNSKQLFHFEIRKGHLPQDPLHYLKS